MIRLLLHLNPFKRFILISILLTCLCLALFSNLVQIPQLINAKSLVLSQQISLIPEKNLMFFIVCIICISSGITILHYYELKELKETLQHSLSEKKLDQHFSKLFEGKSFKEVSYNIETVFQLYKSFDTMKSTRINLEVSTLKILISHIEEGIIFVDKDKIVTHINQIGEHLFKLIPGEIINQSISRKIHSSTVLESIDLCLKEEKKVINKTISIGDDTPLLCSIIPIRNKQNNAIRALILVKKPNNTDQNDTSSLNP